MNTLHFRTLINNLINDRINRLVIVCFFAILFSVYSQDSQSATSNDPHYSKVGFFDIHVCNWPNRPLFFMTIYSTYKFNNILNIQVFSPNNKKIGELNLKKYRSIIDKKKKEKRVFITQFEIPTGANNGWYYTKVNLKDGTSVISKDYVIIEKLQIASISSPDIQHELKSIPKSFIFKKIKSAKFFQVFIHDRWESKLIYRSKLLTKPEIHIPPNLLKKGGAYSIQIHARDINEHPLLGDFNHGSLTKKLDFSIAD